VRNHPLSAALASGLSPLAPVLLYKTTAKQYKEGVTIFMKNILLFIVILLLLSGCANENESNNTARYVAEEERFMVAEARAEAAEEQVIELEGRLSGLEEELLKAKTRAETAEEQASMIEEQNSDLTMKLVIAESRAGAAEEELDNMNQLGPGNTVRNKNVVVKNPKKNQVTYEIDERLVGKYIVEDDPEMYFEIKPDGTAEISINELEGYGQYPSRNLQVTAYYSASIVTDDFIYRGRVYINFNLVSGRYTFPAACGLSLTFCDDYNDFTSFELISYLPTEHFKFVKQN
jgi:TolA-binding protein